MPYPKQPTPDDCGRYLVRITEAEWARLKPQLRKAAYEIAVLTAIDRTPCGIDDVAGYAYRDLYASLIRAKFWVVSEPGRPSDQAFAWCPTRNDWLPNWRKLFAVGKGWGERLGKDGEA